MFSWIAETPSPFTAYLWQMFGKMEYGCLPHEMGAERPRVFPAEGPIRGTYDWWETYIGVRKSKYSGVRNVGSLCPPIPYQQQTALTRFSLVSGSATPQCLSLATLCDGASGQGGYGAVWFHNTVMVGLVYSFIQPFTYSISIY